MEEQEMKQFWTWLCGRSDPSVWAERGVPNWIVLVVVPTIILTCPIWMPLIVMYLLWVWLTE